MTKAADDYESIARHLKELETFKGLEISGYVVDQAEELDEDDGEATDEDVEAVAAGVAGGEERKGDAIPVNAGRSPEPIPSARFLISAFKMRC